ncbi:MAG: permease-like cell division protein FtsX [Cyanobacteria bacterium P01_H01_bin.74]
MKLVDNLATEMRISWRVVQETIGGMQRTGWMNLIIVITMASILTIFGTLSVFLLETQLFVENIGSVLKISVYLKDNADIARTERSIRALPDIKQIEVVSKEKAWREMKKEYKVPNIKNPLPNTLHVQVGNKAGIEAIAKKIKSLSSVEAVSYAKSVLKKLHSISQLTSMIGLIISLFLGTLTFFIISNTIHLVIEARGREIEIMRMMGVGNWYVRLPFVLQGSAYGLAGSIISLVPLILVESFISKLFQYFQFSVSQYSLSVVFMILILMGILVGAGAATMATHRYLKI